MPLTRGQRVRLQEELDDKGLTAKDASLRTKWRTGRKVGRSLNATYLSQVLSQKARGALDVIEWVCEDNGLDFQHVKTDKRSSSPKGPPAAAAAPLDFDRLRFLIESALQVYGANPQQAVEMAKTVLSTWRGKQSHG